MRVEVKRVVEAGTNRGGEDLVLLLEANFTGSKDELLVLLEDTARLRQAVVSSFDGYRGVNGEEVDLFTTEEEVEEYKRSVDGFGFWKEDDAGEVVELFWVYRTDYYEQEFDDRPAEDLFDECVTALQRHDRWSSNLAEPNKWSFGRTELDRTGNAD